MEPDEYQRRRDALLAEVEGRPLVPPAEPAPSAEEGAAQPDPPPPMPQHGVCEYAPKPMNREAEVQRWFDAALLAQAQGRPIDAIRDFQMVLARDPDRTSDLTWRAEEQIRIEKAGLAAKATPLRDRAERARAQGDDLAERAAWRDLLAIDPWDQAAPARLAEIQATLDTRAQGVFEEGKREAAAGRAEGAMERFRTVLELVPDAHAPLHQKTQLAIERLLEASQPTQDPPGPEEPVPR
jgi:tetratricopeptide (TPR) repeat protein